MQEGKQRLRMIVDARWTLGNHRPLSLGPPRPDDGGGPGHGGSIFSWLRRTSEAFSTAKLREYFAFLAVEVSFLSPILVDGDFVVSCLRH